MCINNNFSKDDILLSLNTDNGIIGFIYHSIVSLYKIIILFSLGIYILQQEKTKFNCTKYEKRVPERTPIRNIYL